MTQLDLFNVESAQKATYDVNIDSGKWAVDIGDVWALPSVANPGLHHVLYCNSWENVLPIPDVLAELCLTDPPYMLTDIKFDKDGINMEWVNTTMKNVIDTGYLASFGSIELLSDICKYLHMRFSGVWVKGRGVMRTSTARLPMTESEPYAVYCIKGTSPSKLTYNKVLRVGTPYKKIQRKTAYKREGTDQIDRANASAWGEDGFKSTNTGSRQYTDTLIFPNKPSMPFIERTSHPTQKNISMLTVIIRWFTNTGWTIIDPFCGSGTTIAAAERVGRLCIGIEKKPLYVGEALSLYERLYKQRPYKLNTADESDMNELQ